VPSGTVACADPFAAAFGVRPVVVSGSGHGTGMFDDHPI
jgi:hypothetical protein